MYTEETPGPHGSSVSGALRIPSQKGFSTALLGSPAREPVSLAPSAGSRNSQVFLARLPRAGSSEGTGDTDHGGDDK